MQCGQGPTGAAGAKGIDGVTGPQGFPGKKGPTGVTGMTGPAGLQGWRGYPGPSPVPVMIQNLSTTLTQSVRGSTTSTISLLNTGSPPLSGGASTTISGMTLNTATGVISGLGGTCYVEAACSFPSDTNITSGSLNLYETGGVIRLLGTRIAPGTGGLSGSSFISGVYLFQSGKSYTFNCDLTFASPVDTIIPLASVDAPTVVPTVVVTFIKV